MIDVHIHVVPPNLPGTGSLAPLLKSAPDVVAGELRRQMQTTGVTHAFAMGEWDAGPDDPLGVNRTLAIASMVPGLKAIGVADPTKTGDDHFGRCEEVLREGRVVALKCYLAYLYYEPAHPNYRRYYELAARYRVPVMFHTGDTFSPLAKLKYAHPLGVDEVAVDHPDTRFVMCHAGNPWMSDCAEVVYKNMNVWADLSGLIVGDDAAFVSAESRDTAADLAHDIARAIKYSERPNRFLYGTDWPLAPMPAYRDFVRTAVPETFHELVFEENAHLLYRLR
ncbi:MAG: Amidohydrolase [Gemmataceae bacterium]|nr:Amidohydrolase [Gemmataceae bacterium]